MFTSEPKFFSIGTISLTLDIMDEVVVNILQIRRIIDNLDSVVEPILIHNGSIE
jgi:hypothetical protein